MKKLLHLLTAICATSIAVSCTDAPVPVSEPVAPVVTQVKNTPAKKPTAEVKKSVMPGAITSLDIGQVFTMKESGKAVVIDVRPPLYYRLGHINGAESMPLIKYDKIIAAKRPQLDAAVKDGKVIVLYCQNSNCPDAHKTAVKLAKLGYSASVFRGGWEEWKQAGME